MQKKGGGSGKDEEESSVKDGGTETAIITTYEEEIPVTWDSEPAYDGETEGSYVFTADVGSYVLSGSVKLPTITVTVVADTVEKPTGESLPCTQTEGCTLANGHEGDCVPAPPANDGLVKTITRWTFVDDENLNEGVLPLINVSMEQQADFDTVVDLLPTQLSAVIEGETEPAPLDITGWTCPEYIPDGEGNWPLTGDYTFTAALTDGYACDPLPTVKVLLGGANTYVINNTLTAGGLTVAASEGGEVDYTEGSGFTLKASGTYEITGTWNGNLDITGDSKKAVITVPDRVSANVILDGVTIDVSATDYACAFTVDEAGGSAILTLQGTNTLASGRTRAGLEVPEAAWITIRGGGSLTAGSKYADRTKGGSGAGIGGGDGQNGGTISIESGIVIATGGGGYRFTTGTTSGGAGIGGGTGKDGGTITIWGGNVTATGGPGGAGGGAGIGGGGKTIDDSGISGNGGTITIRGGSVTATGGNEVYPGASAGGGGGAGIGGGGGSLRLDEARTGANGGTIIIRGGSVTATGGEEGAGIGGGDSGSSGIIIIEDAKITAAGEAGIGSGSSGSSETITIKNSEIEAAGVGSGAGIGGGDGTITIENCKIKAIGSGSDSGEGGAGIGGGGRRNSGTIIIKNSEIEAAGGDSGAGIGGGYSGSGETITIENSRIKAKGASNYASNGGGAGIGGGYAVSDYAGTGGSSGTITIINSEIEAEGGTTGAGIGTGGGGPSPGVSVGSITIEGGFITATGNGDGAGIGGGRGVSSDGRITIAGGARVIASAIGDDPGYVSGAGIGGSDAGRGVTVTISGAGTKVTATGFGGGYDVGSGKRNSDGDGGSLSVTDGAVLEMKSIGTNAASLEYKSCTMIDANGIWTFYDANGNKIAQTPEITLQPQSHTVTLGGAVTLSVAAGVADGGTISYQWYSSTENKTTDGIPVGADTPSYSPSTDTAGTMYYYAVATNTNHGAAVAAVSNAAAVKVNPFNAETPAITSQPQGGVYTQNTGATLTVDASVSDGGTLTYQWYSSAANSNTGGNPVSGANTASYTVPTGTVGIIYYYVVVTNTNDDAGIQKTANITSSVTAVTVTRAGSSGGGGGSYTAPNPKSSYTVTGDRIFQTIARSDIKALADKQRSLTLDCDKAGMAFEPAALQAILTAVPATVGSVTFTAVPADLSAFPDGAVLIGSRPVYDFTISYKDSNGNSVAVPVNFPAGAASIFLNCTPAAEEVTGSLFVVYVDGQGGVTWLNKSSCNNGRVLAEVPHFSTYGVAYKTPVPVFTDIGDHWAKEDMEFAAARGLLFSTGNNLFSPDGTMTRGMLAAALGRLAGVNPDSYQSRSFTDVNADADYAAYVEWATQKNMIGGTGEGLFSPDAPVTREQMAVIMANYAGQMGYSIPAPLAAVTFADNDKISQEAAGKVAAMQQAGIVRGKDKNHFEPQASATRAEVSAMLHRFVEVVIDPDTATGWVKNDSGDWLYYKSGKALTGWQEMGGKWYYFDQNGIMAVSTNIDGYEIGPDGAMK